MTWQEALMTWRGALARKHASWRSEESQRATRGAHGQALRGGGRLLHRRGVVGERVVEVRKLLREDLARPGRVGAQRRSRARHAARGAGRSAGFRVSKGSLGPNLDEGPADPTRLHACTIVCKTPGRAQSPSLAIEQLSIAPGQQARKSGSMPVPNSNLYGGTTRKASVYT